MSKPKTGVELIAEERKRQIHKEGWTAEHDDIEHGRGDLAIAGACYALTPTVRDLRILNKTVIQLLWPWEMVWWNPANPASARGPKRIKELAKAGALIAAEIDRLQRLPSERTKR